MLRGDGSRPNRPRALMLRDSENKERGVLFWAILTQ